MLSGVPQDRLYCIRREVDRRVAIESAIAEAEPCDIVVIAGKGHEQTQILENEVIAFDDKKVAEEAMRKRLAGNGV